MQLSCTNRDCLLDLADLPLSLPFRAAERKQERVLKCPVCGTPDIRLRLHAFGVFLRETPDGAEFCTWAPPGVPLKQGPQGYIVQVPGKRLRLTFDVLKAISAKEICYPSVLSFAQRDGARFPTLPVRPEYFDCVDDAVLQAELAKNGDKLWHLRGGQIIYQVPLRGLPEGRQMQELALQVRGAAPGGDGSVASVEGVNLRVWPRAIPRWQLHLVGLAATNQTGERLLASGFLRAKVRTSEDPVFRDLRGRQRGGHAVAGQTATRPNWLSVELSEGPGPNAAGGLFWVPPVPNDASAGTLYLGVDFGTSNTCIAYKSHQQSNDQGLVPPVDEESLYHYLVRSGPESTSHAGPDLWPVGSGVGTRRDLFPSELLFSTSHKELGTTPARLDQLRFGEDYGIPGPSVETVPPYREIDHVVAEFKWRDSLAMAGDHGAKLAAQTTLLQQRYLEAVLMQAMARILTKNDRAPESIHITYSFPLAFGKLDHAHLDAAIEGACAQLKAMTGAKDVYFQKGLDESQAAAGAGGPDAQMSVFVDMGGGSTDIAAFWEQGGKHRVPLYSTSVHYAGQALIQGFIGKNAATSCLNDKGMVELGRRVREVGRLSDLRQTLFKPQSAGDDKIEKRARHFYAYVVEYVARLIVAAFIEGRVTSEEDGAFGDVCNVVVFFLGNGWGFVEFVNHHPYEYLVDAVRERIGQIIRDDEDARNTRDAAGNKLSNIRFNFADGSMRGLPHRKAAVAIGVLKTGMSGEKHEPDEGRVGIVGWTTKVNDGKQQVIPWYRLVNTTRVGGYQNMFGAMELEQAKGPQAQPAPAASAFSFPGMASPSGGLVPGAAVHCLFNGQRMQARVLVVEPGRAQVEFSARDPLGQFPRSPVPVGQLRVEAAATGGFPGMASSPFPGMPQPSAPIGFPGMPGAGGAVPGSRVSTEHEGKVFSGMIVDLSGAIATVEWHAVRAYYPVSELQPEGPVLSAPPATALRHAPAAAASWRTRPVPKRISHDDKLSWQDSPPHFDRTITGPFKLDENLSDSRTGLRSSCEGMDKGWLKASPYEAMLYYLFRTHLHEI